MPVACPMPSHDAPAERAAATTYDEDRSQIRTGAAPQVMATVRNPPSACCDWPAGPTSPKPSDITPDIPTWRSTY